MTAAKERGSSHAGPPRARMTYRVGVVGHRPHRLPSHPEGLEAIGERLAEILSTIAAAVREIHEETAGQFYSAEEPALVAVSSLAEGADRLFAREALDLGYRLTCVMPFAQGEFETDFCSPEAQTRSALEGFRELLARAQASGVLTRFELDGKAAERDRAYDEAARVVLNQSDLLIAIWDGSLGGGVGGTAASLLAAMESGIPVIWIDAHAPGRGRILRDTADLGALEQDIEAEQGGAVPAPAPAPSLGEPIRQLARAELGLPDAKAALAHLTDFFAERRPVVNVAFAWKVFRELVGGYRFALPPLRVRDYVEASAADWPVETPAAPDGAFLGTPWINAALRAPFAWADCLAERYADAHRSAFIWSSLLAASAVLLALLPMAAGWAGEKRQVGAMAVLEAVALAVLVSLPVLAQRRRWHQRWLEYRVLAELIRELRILTPLGGARPFPHAKPHLAAYGDPAQSWMYWQTRAIARAVGLPPARADRVYLDDQAAHLAAFLGRPGKDRAGEPGRGGQIGFHLTNSERMERIHHRLHLMALTLFVITILGVAFHVASFLEGVGTPDWVERWLILSAAFLPALGAALASINNLGEFARLHRRSRAMAEGLTVLAESLGRLCARAGGPTLAELADVAGETAGMMVDENIDWRIVVLDVPHAAS